jgi:hypothetical protein
LPDGFDLPEPFELPPDFDLPDAGFEPVGVVPVAGVELELVVVDVELPDEEDDGDDEPPLP